MVLKSVYMDYLKSKREIFQIDLTSKCNLKCDCCVAEWIDRTKPDIPLDKAKQIFDQYKELYGETVYIILSCNAEPTCYYAFENLLSYMDSIFKDSILTFDTNGIKLTDNLYNVLSNIKNNKITISISMFGYDENSFNKYHTRTPNLFKQQKENIIKYLELANKNELIQINFSTPIITEIWVEKVYSYLKTLTDKEIVFVNGGFRETNKIGFLTRTYKKTAKSYISGKETLEIDWSIDCPKCFKTINVTDNGNVFICIGSNNRNDATTDTSVGNVFEQSLKDILSSDKMVELINRYKKKQPLFNVCRNCQSAYCGSDLITNEIEKLKKKIQG